MISGAAFNGGGDTWTGTGIISSAAAADASKFGLGFLDGGEDANALRQGDVGEHQIIIQYTLLGDAYLEGAVGFDDLVITAQHYGATGDDWAGGNFDYDPSGSVGFADLISVAQNYGDKLNQTEITVPAAAMPLSTSAVVVSSKATNMDTDDVVEAALPAPGDLFQQILDFALAQ